MFRLMVSCKTSKLYNRMAFMNRISLISPILFIPLHLSIKLFKADIVQLPVPSHPIWSLTCPLPVPYPSLTCPSPVPYLSGLPRPLKGMILYFI